MKNFEEFYKKQIFDRWEKNYIDCIETAKNIKNSQYNVEEKKLTEKIDNSINRGEWGSEMTKDIIIDKIISTDVFAVNRFSKTPHRQNISEECQLNYINEHKDVAIKKHCNDLRFTNGGSMITEGKISGANSKSFDYELVSENTDIYYGTGKVTNSVGGHQDNVEEEVIKYLTDCVNYVRFHEDNIKFFILIDGNFWTEEKVNKLKKYENDRVKVFNSDNITNKW